MCASHAQGRRFEPGRKQASLCYAYDSFIILSEHSLSCYLCQGFHGVMVSTLDFESSDPSSNLGGTWLTPWRNGSASDSRSEGCVFESRRGHNIFGRFWSSLCIHEKIDCASNEDWTHDLWFTRPTLCHWAIEAPAGDLLQSIQKKISITVSGKSKKNFPSTELQWTQIVGGNQ